MEVEAASQVWWGKKVESGDRIAVGSALATGASVGSEVEERLPWKIL